MNATYKDIVRQIKEQTDIVELVARSVPLKKSGSSYLGVCPFHADKSPSMSVVPAKGIFHCFACHAGGSVIDYVMRKDRMEFREAVEVLAKELGLEVPVGRPEDRRKHEEEQQARLTLQTLNEAALRWFRRNMQLGKNPVANAYVQTRGLSSEICEKFRIGVSTEGWEDLKNHLLGQGFSEELLVDGGLCKSSEKGRVYDLFRNRLIFPICDVNGKPVAFGGRRLDEDKNSPKYLNSPATALYDKGSTVYALDLARADIERTGYAIICEGYMDVITAHAYGHTQAVACLGTALTKQQAKLIRRFANRVYFLFDGDAAGQTNMLARGVGLLEADFDVRVISLPKEHDPDTFLREKGSEALSALIPEAEEFVSFALRIHGADLDMQTLAGQAEFVERVSPVLNGLKNEIMREGALQRVLKRIGGIPRDAVERILEGKRKQAEANTAARERPPVPVDGEDNLPGARGTSSLPHESGESVVPGVDRLELSLLKTMIESYPALQTARAQIHRNWIMDPKLEGWILYFMDNDGDVRALLEDLDEVEALPGRMEVLHAVLAWAYPFPLGSAPAEWMHELALRLHERHRHRLIAQLSGMLQKSSLKDDELRRLQSLLDHEYKMRFQHSGRVLRAGDAEARKARRFGK